MLIGAAVAGFSVHRTDSVSKLCNFQRNPFQLGSVPDDFCHHGSLADVARVSANHNNFTHIVIIVSGLTAKPQRISPPYETGDQEWLKRSNLPLTPSLIRRGNSVFSVSVP